MVTGAGNQISLNADGASTVITLPEDVFVDRVKAAESNGILFVNLPRLRTEGEPGPDLNNGAIFRVALDEPDDAQKIADVAQIGNMFDGVLYASDSRQNVIWAVPAS